MPHFPNTMQILLTPCAGKIRHISIGMLIMPGGLELILLDSQRFKARLTFVNRLTVVNSDVKIGAFYCLSNSSLLILVEMCLS